MHSAMFPFQDEEVKRAFDVLAERCIALKMTNDKLGEAHEYCQKYQIAGPDDNVWHAILADAKLLRKRLDGTKV